MNEIVHYIMCNKCGRETLKSGEDPLEYARLIVGVTEEGFVQIWCKRHNITVVKLTPEAYEYMLKERMDKESPLYSPKSPRRHAKYTHLTVDISDNGILTECGNCGEQWYRTMEELALVEGIEEDEAFVETHKDCKK